MGPSKAMIFDVSRATGCRFGPGLALHALLGIGVAAGCSPDSPPSTVPPDADAVCPATVSAAETQPCGVEGLRCYPEYACGILSAIATCSCSRGHFSCSDVLGNALDAGDATPACPTPRDSGACPATRSAADLASCVETGLLCAYPRRCPGSSGYDKCECFPEATSDGGVRLRFQCSEPCVDGGALGVGVDASQDAPPDAPTEADAPGADASPDARPRDAAAD
jgi:hypothetical protein